MSYYLSNKLRKVAKQILANNRFGSDEVELYIDLGFDASDKKAYEILNSIFGQLSDGMWENSMRMEKYWKFAGIEIINGRIVVVVSNKAVKYEDWGRKFKTCVNPWINKTNKEIKSKLANFLKQIVKEELGDNYSDSKLWNRKNDGTTLSYLGYKETITVQDAYRVYDKLLDRKTRIFV